MIISMYNDRHLDRLARYPKTQTPWICPVLCDPGLPKGFVRMKCWARSWQVSFGKC